MNSRVAQWPVWANVSALRDSVRPVRVRVATSDSSEDLWAISREASCTAAAFSPVIVPSSAWRFDVSVPDTVS